MALATVLRKNLLNIAFVLGFSAARSLVAHPFCIRVNTKYYLVPNADGETPGPNHGENSRYMQPIDVSLSIVCV